MGSGITSEWIFKAGIIMSVSEQRMKAVETTLADLKLVVKGNGNGVPGLVRKHDRLEMKINFVLWGIGIMIAAVLANLAVALVRLANQPAAQTVNQSVSVDDASELPLPFYTSDEVAAIERVTARTVRERAFRGDYGEVASKDSSGQWRFDREKFDARIRAQTSANAREGAQTRAE